MHPNNRRAGYAAAIAALIVASACLFATKYVVRYTLYDRLSVATAEMIDESLSRDMRTFMTVSAVKAGLAIFTGSTVDAGVGVGVQIEMGDAVQPVYDYVDFVWDSLLYALMVLGFYKLLFETGMLAIGIKVFGLGLLMWGCGHVHAAST